MEFIQAKCKTCGAPFDFEQGKNVIICEYCGNKIVLVDSEKKNGTADISGKIKDLCHQFSRAQGKDFNYSQKLADNLDINSEEIYLTHDDTWAKSGKNGFAITSSGLYCRSLMESGINYISYEKFVHARLFPQIRNFNTDLYADDMQITYWTTSIKKNHEALFNLYKEIQDLLKKEIITNYMNDVNRA